MSARKASPQVKANGAAEFQNRSGTKLIELSRGGGLAEFALREDAERVRGKYEHTSV
jgi:hypothetical protein